LSAVTDMDARSDQMTAARPTSDGAGVGCTPVRTVTALTLVLPCYNEAERLPTTLQALLAHLSHVPSEVEVLVVDDGSTDATATVAGAVAAVDPRVRVLACHPNRGKGFAVRAGMLAATGELVVFTDADGSYGPSELDRLVEALGQAPVAIGARSTGATGPLARRVASRGFNLAIRALLGLPFGDTQSGLKGFRRAAARKIFSRARLDGFAFDVEALWLARRLGLEVVEVGVQAMERPGSKVRVLADAGRMLGEVWALRRARARGAYGDIRQDPTGSPAVVASTADPARVAADQSVLLPAPTRVTGSPWPNGVS
jgi:glycosyltransferase involved in cell wall biosynthesis